MKKIKYAIVIIWAAVSVGLLAGNLTYTYYASKEARRVTHMAYAMERDGIISETNKATVLRFVKRQFSIMYPARSYRHLLGMRKNLQRIRDSWEPKTDNGTYHANLQTMRIEK